MTTTGSRTFDCPWCGAISPVPGVHLGEHFPCPECKKATKLTEKNTSTRAPTAAPPDAPHLSGDRTFDCPWCGAIASVPSSHLGEGFRCPECAKGTKLTSTNTRRALVTAPPPDAPHQESDAPSGNGKAVLVVALLVVAGGGAWYFLAGPGSSSAPEKPPTVTAGKPAKPSDTGPASNAPAAMSETVVPPPAMAAGATPPAMADDAGMPPLVLDPGDKAALSKAAAEARLLTADAALALANKALEDWRQAHPGALEAGESAGALNETAAQIERSLADKALVPDPAKPTPDQIRAADAAVRAFIDASPARKAAAGQVLEALRSDHGGREVAGVADWREIHLTGDGFRRTASALAGGLQALASTVPADLVKAVTDATEEARSARAMMGSESPPIPAK